MNGSHFLWLVRSSLFSLSWACSRLARSVAVRRWSRSSPRSYSMYIQYIAMGERGGGEREGGRKGKGGKEREERGERKGEGGREERRGRKGGEGRRDDHSFLCHVPFQPSHWCSPWSPVLVVELSPSVAQHLHEVCESIVHKICVSTQYLNSHVHTWSIICRLCSGRCKGHIINGNHVLAWVACRSCYVVRCTCVTWSKWFNTWLCEFTQSIRSLISKAFCTGGMVIPAESPRGHEASHGNVWVTLVGYYVIVDVVIWAISFILAGSSVSFSLHWSQRGTGRLWEGYVHAWTINIPQLPEK